MATNNIIKEFITTKMTSNIDNSTLSATESLIDSGVIDSLGIMALIEFLEKNFSIKISGDDLMPENFDSISAISTMIDRMVRQQGAE